MKAFLLVGVVGVMSLGALALAPSQVNARDWQNNDDTVAVRWHGGGRHGDWHDGDHDWHGGDHYWHGGHFYPSYGYSSYYYPSYGYSNYGYYRPGFSFYFRR
jgi:hypothetical protein